MYICVCVRVYAHKYIYIYIYTYTHMYIACCVRVSKLIQSVVHACWYVCTCTANKCMPKKDATTTSCLAMYLRRACWLIRFHMFPPLLWPSLRIRAALLLEGTRGHLHWALASNHLTTRQNTCVFMCTSLHTYTHTLIDMCMHVDAPSSTNSVLPGAALLEAYTSLIRNRASEPPGGYQYDFTSRLCDLHGPDPLVHSDHTAKTV